MLTQENTRTLDKILRNLITLAPTSWYAKMKLGWWGECSDNDSRNGADSGEPPAGFTFE